HFGDCQSRARSALPDLLGVAVYLCAQARLLSARCPGPHPKFFRLSDRTKNLRARRPATGQVPVFLARLAEAFSLRRLRSRARTQAWWGTRLFASKGRAGRGSGVTFPDSCRFS